MCSIVAQLLLPHQRCYTNSRSPDPVKQPGNPADQPRPNLSTIDLIEHFMPAAGVKIRSDFRKALVTIALH